MRKFPCKGPLDWLACSLAGSIQSPSRCCPFVPGKRKLIRTERRVLRGVWIEKRFSWPNELWAEKLRLNFRSFFFLSLFRWCFGFDGPANPYQLFAQKLPKGNLMNLLFERTLLILVRSFSRWSPVVNQEEQATWRLHWTLIWSYILLTCIFI